MTVKEWLESLGHKAENVKLSFAGKSWLGCRFGEEGGVYLVGKAPRKVKGRALHCLDIGGQTWFVSGFIESVPEKFAEFHPFGANFQIRQWTHADPIDLGSRWKYLRVPANLEVIS